MSSMFDKERAAKRTRLQGHIEGEVTVLQPVTILEISELGIRVESFSQLQPDSLHEFRVPLGDRHVVVKGRVVYCHVGHLVGEVMTYYCGVEFTEPPPHALEAIREFLSTLDPTSAPPRVIDGEVEP